MEKGLVWGFGYRYLGVFLLVGGLGVVGEGGVWFFWGWGGREFIVEVLRRFWGLKLIFI